MKMTNKKEFWFLFEAPLKATMKNMTAFNSQQNNDY